MNLNPLDIHLRGKRFLNDRGIKQAINYGFIKISPNLDLTKNTKRLQPATLDIELKKIDSSSDIDKNSLYFSDLNIIKSRSENDVFLTEQIHHDRQVKELPVNFIFPSIEARSSFRRLGVFVPNGGGVFFNTPKGVEVELNNYSYNDIYINEGERFAQIFFRIDPFKDKWDMGYSLQNLKDMNVKNPEEVLKKLNETFEKARSLDMGIEITTNEQLEWLEQKEYLQVFPKLKFENGLILVHASEVANKIKKLDEVVIFSQREKYVDKIFEKIKLSKNYILKPNEHIDIETVESFKLSEHVGIHFYSNPMAKFMKEFNKNGIKTNSNNLSMINVIDGWIDPCYAGNFSRQPKWFSPQIISPGDIVGYGKVIYYPNGVEKGYGSKELGSQYQKSK
ncbi:MAG: hypothetical protein AB7V77_02075 [Candidatus Woesearchaeota archaeon]